MAETIRRHSNSLSSGGDGGRVETLGVKTKHASQSGQPGQSGLGKGHAGNGNAKSKRSAPQESWDSDFLFQHSSTSSLALPSPSPSRSNSRAPTPSSRTTSFSVSPSPSSTSTSPLSLLHSFNSPPPPPPSQREREPVKAQWLPRSTTSSTIDWSDEDVPDPSPTVTRFSPDDTTPRASRPLPPSVEQSRSTSAATTSTWRSGTSSTPSLSAGTGTETEEESVSTTGGSIREVLEPGGKKKKRGRWLRDIFSSSSTSTSTTSTPTPTNTRSDSNSSETPATGPRSGPRPIEGKGTGFIVLGRRMRSTSSMNSTSQSQLPPSIPSASASTTSLSSPAPGLGILGLPNSTSSINLADGSRRGGAKVSFSSIETNLGSERSFSPTFGERRREISAGGTGGYESGTTAGADVSSEDEVEPSTSIKPNFLQRRRRKPPSSSTTTPSTSAATRPFEQDSDNELDLDTWVAIDRPSGFVNQPTPSTTTGKKRVVSGSSSGLAGKGRALIRRRSSSGQGASGSGSGSGEAGKGVPKSSSSTAVPFVAGGGGGASKIPILTTRPTPMPITSISPPTPTSSTPKPSIQLSRNTRPPLPISSTSSTKPSPPPTTTSTSSSKRISLTALLKPSSSSSSNIPPSTTLTRANSLSTRTGMKVSPNQTVRAPSSANGSASREGGRKKGIPTSFSEGDLSAMARTASPTPPLPTPFSTAPPTTARKLHKPSSSSISSIIASPSDTRPSSRASHARPASRSSISLPFGLGIGSGGSRPPDRGAGDERSGGGFFGLGRSRAFSKSEKEKEEDGVGRKKSLRGSSGRSEGKEKEKEKLGEGWKMPLSTSTSPSPSTSTFPSSASTSSVGNGGLVLGGGSKMVQPRSLSRRSKPPVTRRSSGVRTGVVGGGGGGVGGSGHQRNSLSMNAVVDLSTLSTPSAYSTSPLPSPSLFRGTQAQVEGDDGEEGFLELQRRNSLSDLKIPVRFTLAQKRIEEDLERVREFAKGVERLKALRTQYQQLTSLILSPPTSPPLSTPSSPRNSQLSTTSSSPPLASPPAASLAKLSHSLARLQIDYKSTWEACSALIDLGDGKPTSKPDKESPGVVASKRDRCVSLAIDRRDLNLGLGSGEGESDTETEVTGFSASSSGVGSSSGAGSGVGVGGRPKFSRKPSASSVETGTASLEERQREMLRGVLAPSVKGSSLPSRRGTLNGIAGAGGTRPSLAVLRDEVPPLPTTITPTPTTPSRSTFFFSPVSSSNNHLPNSSTTTIVSPSLTTTSNRQNGIRRVSRAGVVGIKDFLMRLKMKAATEDVGSGIGLGLVGGEDSPGRRAVSDPLRTTGATNQGMGEVLMMRSLGPPSLSGAGGGRRKSVISSGDSEEEEDWDRQSTPDVSPRSTVVGTGGGSLSSFPGGTLRRNRTQSSKVGVGGVGGNERMVLTTEAMPSLVLKVKEVAERCQECITRLKGFTV